MDKSCFVSMSAEGKHKRESFFSASVLRLKKTPVERKELGGCGQREARAERHLVRTIFSGHTCWNFHELATSGSLPWSRCGPVSDYRNRRRQRWEEKKCCLQHLGAKEKRTEWFSNPTIITPALAVYWVYWLFYYRALYHCITNCRPSDSYMRGTTGPISWPSDNSQLSSDQNTDAWYTRTGRNAMLLWLLCWESAQKVWARFKMRVPS